MNIRESQIEDILVHFPNLTQRILNLKQEPRLLVRQMGVSSGRLDLLYTYQTYLLLLELKVIPFQSEHVEQVVNYKNDLERLQQVGQLIKGDIKPYVICTSADKKQLEKANQKGVLCLTYNPEFVLRYFYNNYRPIAFFSKIKPIDIGIWNIHLINDFIYYLIEIDSLSELQKRITGSPRTLYNKLKFASELRIIDWVPHQDEISLTPLGKKYVAARNNGVGRFLTDDQTALLNSFITKNPFESSIILGIASIVEAVFTMAKNTNPVNLIQLQDYFSIHAGKYFDWKAKKARYNATRMYSNYAVSLGLLAKYGDALFITPSGARFTLQMQLHKSLKMIDESFLV